MELQFECPLPSYDAPPVVEVAASIRFEPPQGLTPAHLGAFWGGLRREFPSVRALPTIPLPKDLFGIPGRWLPPFIRAAISDQPDHRLLMTSSDDQWVRQVQMDRLVVNWRKRTTEYPRFEAVYSSFLEMWDAWRQFLHEVGVGEIQPQFWEVTYVNRIPQGELWRSARDWPSIFPGLWPVAEVAVEGTEFRGMTGEWVWERAAPPARLQVEARPVAPSGKGTEPALLLNLTARGRISEDSESNESHDAVRHGMHLGRRMIVTTFDALASDQAKEQWGRHVDRA